MAHVSESGREAAAFGQARADRLLADDSLFAVWCLVKPVAIGAAIALAEEAAAGLQTPLAELSPLARDAGLGSSFDLDSLQSLSLPLNVTGLMEGLCREDRDLRSQLVEEISHSISGIVPGTAFHSEYTLWRLVAECLETLTGRQASTALNTLLSSADLDIQFSLDPSSLMVDRLVDYFVGEGEDRAAITHSRSGVLLSTWSMPLGGFSTSVGMADWAHHAFFREGGESAWATPELFPSPAAMERMTNAVLSGASSAVLGLRREGVTTLACRGWLGLSLGLIDLDQRTTTVALCNDLICDPDRLVGLTTRVTGRLSET